MNVPPGPETGPERSPRQQLFPEPGFGRIADRPEQVLLVCYFDPKGISTVIETVAYMQRLSRFSVTVLNVFEHRLDTGYLRLHPWLDLSRFDVIVVHNTVSYNVDNLRALDQGLATTLAAFRGVKVMMKQDENYRFREVARYIGDVGFDLLLTCLPPEGVPLVYPKEVVGSPRIERMLTGYVTPALRQRDPLAGPRPIDIGYRGSIQPLSFGRLAYEKRKIGVQVERRLAGHADIRLDISSRWEDRLGGEEWLDFLASCKATLGAESGASIFDLDGDLDMRCEALERKYAHLDEEARTEAALAELQDLEGNIRYHTISPRHFEAIACGAVQLLYPGAYVGLLQAGRHYLELQRDGSNLEELLAIVRDERARSELARTAFDEVVMNPLNWIETFVHRVDTLIAEALEGKGRARREVAGAAAGVHVASFERGELLPSSAGMSPGTVIHRLRCSADRAEEVPRAQGDGSMLWNVPSAGLGFDIPGGAHQNLATAAAVQALLHIEHLIALPRPQRCAALGLAPGLEADSAMLQRLQAALRDNQELLAAASRVRGVQAILVHDSCLLPAAVLLQNAWAAVLVVVREGAPGDRAERLFWEAWGMNLFAHADAIVSSADVPITLSRLLAGRTARPLTVFAREFGRSSFYVSPPPIPASEPEVRPTSPMRALLKRIWRHLPDGLKKRVIWFRKDFA